MKAVPRTAAVWHPIEELNSFAYLLEDETDRSLGVAQRIALPPAQQFRADASEGFQGAWRQSFEHFRAIPSHFEKITQNSSDTILAQIRCKQESEC